MWQRKKYCFLIYLIFNKVIYKKEDILSSDSLNWTNEIYFAKSKKMQPFSHAKHLINVHIIKKVKNTVRQSSENL